MRSLVQDLGYGLRMLRKSPGFTIIAVLTLALGIGANTAIFSVIDAKFLQPLEFVNPDHLVDIAATSVQRGLTATDVTLPEYLEWKQQSTTIQGMAVHTFAAFTYAQSTGAMRVQGRLVSPDFFTVLGDKPVLGRFFSPDEDQPGKDDVIVITEGFWRRQLGSDPNIIGRTLRIDSKAMTVIGIEPPRTTWPIVNNEMYKPLVLTNEAKMDRNDRSYSVIGRLKDGVTLARARADLANISSKAERAYPATDSGWTADVDTLLERNVGDDRKSVYVLMAAVAFLLLIACLNIASLLTARLTARMKEVGLRTALGANRSRLLRQFLTEGALLSLLGGIGGVLLSFPILKLLIARLPDTVSRIEGIRLDPAVLFFTLLVCAVVGTLFGILPAWSVNRAPITAVLKDVSGGTTSGSAHMRLQNLLVVAQLAISLVLLSGAGLLIRSFVALRDTDPGFRAEGVLVNTQLVLPPDKYTTNIQCVTFFKQLLERIQRFAGVEAAGGITSLPLASNSGFRGYEIVEERVASADQEPTAVRNVVTEGYFRTMGIPLRRGRIFEEKDNENASRVAIINDTLAHKQFKDRDPIGLHIVLHGADSQPYEIVGVVGSSRQFLLAQDPAPEIFTPYRQSRIQYMYILVKTTSNPASLAQPIRSAVHDLDLDQPVGNRTLEMQFENAVAGPRFYALLITVFAALALILAAVGIYGVLSYLVAQRTREIGIRMALGATRANVWNQIIGRGLLLAVIGLGIGIIVSLILARAVTSLLYHVGAGDPWAFAGASAVLVLIAVLACIVPAYRAMKVDPMIALRYE